MNWRLSDRIGSDDFRFLLVAAGCGSLVLLGGCKKEDIHSYRVPPESVSAPDPTPQQPRAPSESFSSSHDVAWTVPAAWREIETTNDMRIATFQTEFGLEVAVTAFPGDVGGLVANVNRWRGQVGLETTDAQGMAENIKRLDGVDVIIVDAIGTGSRLVGSVINVGDGKTWFVKAIGDTDTVERLKPDLIAFSASFHVHQQEGDSTQESQDDPSMSTARSWQQPTQWRVDPNASPILIAGFLTQAGARITLTALANQSGGVLINLNRWRRELGLPLVAALDDQPSKDLGMGAMLIDLASPDGTNRVVAGIVPLSDQSLYFKLTGTGLQVEPELGRFEDFIKGIGLEGRVQP